MAEAKAEGRRRNRVKRLVPWTLVVAAVGLGAWSRPWGSSAGAMISGVPGKATATAEDLAASRAAFLAAYKVLMHPRCMNCHPAGDAPLQGDDSHVHAQNVQRGPDGKGKYALKCANCHQLANLPGANMPPGNPNWHLPPPEMKMVFQGKTPRELARQLKDPAQNGHKTLDQILHHVAEDKLVLGGWEPGDGRTRPPLTHDEFVRKMREWIEKGAAEPE
jgi:mono/diheme cytochrome c family protein